MVLGHPEGASGDEYQALVGIAVGKSEEESFTAKAQRPQRGAEGSIR